MATIQYLIRCTGCKKRVKENENFTVWEVEHYCEPCFDEYLDMINPADLLASKDKNNSED